MIKILNIPILKRIIPSILIRFLKLIRKNRGYFKIKGVNMFLDFLDPIDRQIILHKEFEDLEINFLIKQIDKHEMNYFIDVGANCGYYSVKIAKEFEKIIVLSFEPNPDAYLKFSKTLSKNILLSKKITLKNYGLSDKSSKLKMQSLVKFGYAQTGGSSVVKDNELDKHFTFFAKFKNGDEKIKIKDRKIAIKIDVEGHEINVLNGIKNILKNNKCVIQIEIFDRNYKYVNNYLSKIGYSKFYKIKKRLNYFYKNFK